MDNNGYLRSNDFSNLMKGVNLIALEKTLNEVNISAVNSAKN